MSDLVYLYAVVSAASPPSPLPAGLEGGPTRALVEGGLAAVVSDVPARLYDEDALNEHLRDLEWLGPRAMRHQDVNAQLFDLTDAMLPFRFGTVFRDEARPRALLRETVDLVERLDRIRGRGEWVVTVRRDAEAARTAVDAHGTQVTRLRAEIDAAPPGRAYLLRRRLDDARREGLLELDARVLAEARAALEPLADQSFREPVVDGGSVEHANAVARLSLLVARTEENRLRNSFDDLTARWRPDGYWLEATGPWPPYRFGGLG